MKNKDNLASGIYSIKKLFPIYFIFLLALIPVLLRVTVDVYAAGITLPAGSSLKLNTATLNMAGDVVNADTIVVTTGTITLTGTWNNTGTFTAGTSTVSLLDGQSPVSILGESTFYNFSAVTTTGKQINFVAASTQTVTNSLTLQGAASNLLVLRSTITSTRAYINLQAGATQTIDYVNVNDHEATGQHIAYGTAASFNSVDLGNNHKWFNETVDTDGDGMPDPWEDAHGLNPAIDDSNADPDEDDLTNLQEYNNSTDPQDSDSDDDDMPDGWEVEYGLNPLVDDSGEDADEDGWTNLEEYQNESSPNNACPNKPAPLSPANSDTEISLIPTLQGSVYSDSDLDAHLATHWQIANYTGSFSGTDLIFEDTPSTLDITDLEKVFLVSGILSADTTYYWRLRYMDNATLPAWSQWPDTDISQFTTVSAAQAGDTNANGIPDAQEVADTVDVDGDGTPDNFQDTIVTLRSVVSGEIVAIKTDTGIIAQAQTQYAESISGKPENYNFPDGLFSFRIEDVTPGSRIEVTFYLSWIFTVNDRWYKYDDINGWQNYTGRIVDGLETDQVTLEFKDGDYENGYGDSDGTENGVIVDPGGPGRFTGSDAAASAEEDDDGDEGSAALKDACFIATACYGTSETKEVETLRQFRDQYLLTNPLGKAFLKSYYTLSPPLAEFISKHPLLKKIGRITLKPLVWGSRKFIQ